MSAETLSIKRPLDEPLVNGSNNDSKRRQSSGAIVKSKKNPIGEDGLSKCFHKCRTRLYVSLAPCYMTNPIEGIKQQHLDPLLMTYFQKVGGIVLSYYNIKLSNSNIKKEEHENENNEISTETIAVAPISAESPFCFFWCSVDFLVWRPVIDDVVEGWSYMQTQSHIGLLIHDTFNATIKKFNIPSDWTFVPNQVDEYAEDEEAESTTTDNKKGNFRSLGQWLDENGNPVEGKLKFTIKALHTASRVVTVEGTLLAPGSERESLPVVRDSGSAKQHKKFDDISDDIDESAIPLADTDKDQDTEIPVYAREDDDEDEDNKIVNDENSSDEEED
ncbi:hypothetical protein B5S31_g2147 [[Candida] boidinii]|nr:hypothetical protein B5S29_g1834 [[Candida] boidinii]OWB72437.1 hypothetical protein B5S31_g2147 [[Candida] boidinii]